MKIRWRLTWYGIGFTALSLVVFIVVINFLVVGSAQKDQDELLGRIADEAAAALAEVDAVELTQSVPPAIPDSTVSDQAFFTVYDDQGIVYYATGTVGGETLVLPASVVVETIEEGSSAVSTSGVRVPPLVPGRVRRRSAHGCSDRCVVHGRACLAALEAPRRDHRRHRIDR